MVTATHISIPLGIFIGLLASFVQSLGLTIQRKSHVQNQLLPECQQRVEHRRPLWLLGFAIFISSNILGSFVQIASLPVVILAPLGAVSLLWNAFFARLLLGDIFSPWMILGTLLIAGGAILIAFFGIVPEQTRSLDDLLALFRRPTFVAYFSILGVVVFGCLAITHIVEFSLSRSIHAAASPETPSEDFARSSLDIRLSSHPGNAPFNLAENETQPTERTPLLDSKARNSSPSQSSTDLKDGKIELQSITRTRLFVAVSYASFSGIISGMCLIFAKSGVELLLLTLGGDNQFWRWESWVLVLGLVIFALLQLWYLHKALVLADPTLVCPSAFCFYNLSSIVNGLVYFDQFSLITPLHLALVGLGIIVLLAGVWVVSIQSGEGGVDVGSWNEEDIRLTSQDNLQSLLEPRDEVTTALLPSTTSTHETPRDVGKRVIAVDRMTQSESSLPNVPASTVEPPSEEQGSLFATPPRCSTGLYSAPRSPSQFTKPSVNLNRRTTADQYLSTTSPPHARVVSHPHTQANYIHPANIPAVAPGFSIGLSPVSPGFTIMPVDRRRPSIIGHAPSLADIANEIIGGPNGGRRRTLSEGELRRRSGNGLDNHTQASGSGSQERRESDSLVGSAPVEGVSTHSTTSGDGKQRWQWLRKVLTGKD